MIWNLGNTDKIGTFRISEDAGSCRFLQNIAATFPRRDTPVTRENPGLFDLKLTAQFTDQLKRLEAIRAAGN